MRPGKSHGVSRHVSCVETVSRHGFSWLSLDTCMSFLGSVSSSMSRFVSCLMTLLGIAKCLLCVETLTFLAESRPLSHLFAVYLLTAKRFFFMVVVILSL